MFIFDKVGEGQEVTHQFDITGSTYAPDGEVWVIELNTPPLLPSPPALIPIANPYPNL